MVFDYLSCVIDAIHIVESLNSSDSVTDTVEARAGLPMGEAMELGAPASPSLRPVVPAVVPNLRSVALAAYPTLRHAVPVADPSLRHVARAADPSLWPVAPTADPSLRHVAPVADPSLWPVALTVDPSLWPVAPTVDPSLRSVTPTTRPNVRISEQPARKCPKFRYIKESRYPSPVPGATSSKDRETFPTIEITNYTGKVDIIVSCVTKDAPYRPHPHKLAGRANCFNGLCVMTVDITPENREVTFCNIGIQCVKRNDISASLALRKKQIDLFHTGFDHVTSTLDIDLHAVRLCFQVFFKSPEWYVPIVSDVIYNGPRMPDLKIVKSSHVFGSVRGGTEVILLCEEMKPEDVVVTLHTEDGAAVWRAPADCVTFHKNVAVVFTTPPYKDPDTPSPVTVYIQLQSRSTDDRSARIRFTYVPDSDSDYIERKRKKPLQKSLMDQIHYIYSVWEAVKTEPCGMGSKHTQYISYGLQPRVSISCTRAKPVQYSPRNSISCTLARPINS